MERMDDSLTTEYETWLRSWGATDATVRTRMSTVNTLTREGVDPLAVDSGGLAAWISSHDWRGWTLSTYYSTLRSFFGGSGAGVAQGGEQATGERHRPVLASLAVAHP